VGSPAARMYKLVTQPHNIQERDRQQEPASPVDSQEYECQREADVQCRTGWQVCLERC
jgi:hypothetical protein